MPDIDALIERYVLLRDKKAQIKAAYEAEVAEYDGAMDRIEGAIMAHLNATGTTKTGSKAGTAFIEKTTSCTTADAEAFFSYVQANGLWHLMDKRPNKTAVAEFRAANDDIPPGLNWREEAVVRIRRA